MTKAPPPPPITDSTPSPEEIAADHLVRKLSLLGPVVWLYGQVPEYRLLFMQDLEWAVLTPLLSNQYCLFRRNKLPYAFFTWAYVTDEVQQRLLSGQRKLAPHEWTNGQHLWLIDVVAPPAELERLLNEVQQLNLRGQRLRYMVVNPATKKLEAREWIGSPKIQAMHPAPPQKH